MAATAGTIVGVILPAGIQLTFGSINIVSCQKGSMQAQTPKAVPQMLHQYPYTAGW